MFKSNLEASGTEKFVDGVGRLLDHRAAFWKRAVEEGKFFADGLAQFGIGEPGDIVEISGEARRFFHVERDHHPGVFGREIVADLGKEPAGDKLVGTALQVAAAYLGADLHGGQSGDLRFAEDFRAVGADFAKRCGGRGRVGSLRRERVRSGDSRDEKRHEARADELTHAFILAENRPVYSTVTDFARLRG